MEVSACKLTGIPTMLPNGGSENAKKYIADMRKFSATIELVKKLASGHHGLITKISCKSFCFCDIMEAEKNMDETTKFEDLTFWNM